MKQTELNPKKVTDLVPLNSIGSMLDSTNGLIYPMNTDGTADMHEGTATDVREVDATVLCFKLSDKDFNSIMSSILHRIEMDVYKNE